FRPGVPALDVFPLDLWARLASRHYRRSSRLLFTEADPRGYPPLREAVAHYLGVSRGVRCEAEQVVIVAGAQQGVHLAARVCLDPGEAAWMEEPGYPDARRALLDAGVRVVPVPVDRDGLDVAAGRLRAADARLVFVTPAHQAPLGMVMSVGRRLALLEWARERGAWILEDDYDSEYRYSGHPLPALQGLAEANERVLYLGTFSKTLFPALRLGYLVVPHSLVDAIAGARALVDRHSPLVDQAIVADFMESGHFARHLRRTRAIYAERQGALLAAAGEELAGLVRLAPDQGGLQLIAWLPPGVSADAAAGAARHAGVDCLSLARYYAEPRPDAPEALMLGYAGFDGPELRRAARSLARALRPLVRAAAGGPRQHSSASR
ncbi:MAG TPA: PLP-dependent aminotransferase family protein, partial [Gemmatimonadaceae bacterium]|nr:PLP-dependent aminotransferase family protein [Gemmatimonadaceae bacterium]